MVTLLNNCRGGESAKVDDLKDGVHVNLAQTHKRTLKCWKCGKAGHVKQDCRETDNEDNDDTDASTQSNHSRVAGSNYN